jgi:hypothetical protein
VQIRGSAGLTALRYARGHCGHGGMKCHRFVTKLQT